jgi:hypothetical protein
MTSIAGNHRIAADLVDQLIAPPEVGAVVLATYLTGSRSTAVFRPDSDWDLTLVLHPDRPDAELLRAVRTLAERITAVRSAERFPGEIAVPKLVTAPVLRRCLEWDAPTFGELFWRHGQLLTGPEVRSGPLGPADPAVRRRVARAAITRSLLQICYHRWRHATGQDRFALPFSQVGRVLRALRHYADGGFPIEPAAYPNALVELCGFGRSDPVVRAVAGAMDSARLEMSGVDWDRWLAAVCAVAGIEGQEGRPAACGPAEPCWLPTARPIPWTTRWRISVTPLASVGPNPSLTPGLVREWLDWTASPHWRATFFAYLIYNQWNKAVDVLVDAAAGKPFPPGSVRADLARVDYLLDKIPFDSLSPQDIQRARSGVEQSAAGFPQAWRELCALIDGAGEQLAVPGTAIRAEEER